MLIIIVYRENFNFYSNDASSLKQPALALSNVSLAFNIAFDISCASKIGYEF